LRPQPKIIKINSEVVKQPRNAFIQSFLEMDFDEALTFDNYDDMRRQYHSIFAYCKSKSFDYKVKQYADKNSNQYLILKVSA